MKNLTTIVLLITLSFQICTSQSFPDLDWYHHKADSLGYPGISSNPAYERLIKQKTGIPVVVAIIDSGVDIHHEDLKEKIWINQDEIPNNEIDDDNNGYIDDIYGWNFIGNPNGENVDADSYEVTRIYSKLRYRYENANPSLLNKDQKKEYTLFLKCKEEVVAKRKMAEQNLSQINMAENYLTELVNSVDNALKDQNLELEHLDSIEYESNQKLFTAISFFRSIKEENGFLPTVDELREGIKLQFTHQKKPLESELNYSYNPDFNSREIIGDNYEDASERYYGNNDVIGSDAFHGTHVSGIIAAKRNNEIGMDGIAENVKIMPIRVVPDGDEHDKDVANGIKYAVENGASIINMSFGKYYEWNKDIVDEAVRFAEDHDVLIVHAAGNESLNNDQTIHFPSKMFKHKKGFLFFKDKEADNWIEVGASSWTTDENLIAPFSNYGKEQVDIFAPGMFIYSTAMQNQYEIAQGTSMAAPVVTGVAAVIRSLFPGLTAKQVRESILESVTTLDIEVIKPGTDEKVPFSELSKTGGIINMESAIIKAAQMKPKKKIRKVESVTRV